jgi:type III secretion protein V
LRPFSSLRSLSVFQRLFGQPDIFLAIVIITVMALFIVPVPTFIIDILICANISLALIILLLAIYIPDSLKLSTFPSLLLITTLFRLGLNVATSRLILLNADAGEMVLAFGNTVVGGNLIVGTVIFLLLMLINMLVVAKGSERVAEVAARFTLDAMPGKQMSIDADLRSGILDLEQARKKREELSKESQLFGAMDGAMKFVKGDVIAGIVIFAINILAGIMIGTLQLGMDINEALSTYCILSVGDGLVSIIPSLLISVCAGLIVTRVNDDHGTNLGTDVAAQIFKFPRAFFLAAAFIGLLALLPGLPKVPLFFLAALIGFCGFIIRRHSHDLKPSQSSLAIFEDDAHDAEALKLNDIKQLGVVPICIEVAPNLVPFVDDKSNFISELIPLLRESLESELGIDFPGIRVRAALPHDLPDSHYQILLNEVPIELGLIEAQECLVAAAPHELRELGISQVKTAFHPCTKTLASITDIRFKEQLEKASLSVWDAPSRILLHLSALLRKNARDFITLHESQMMLDRLEQHYPSLVKEVIPRAVSLMQLTDVLKRLLSEEISIKDIKTILQTLAEYGPNQPDTVILTEYVRASLSRYICYRFGQGFETLLVYLLSPEIEDSIRAAIERHPHGAYLALEPALSQEILEAFRLELKQLPPGGRQPVILTSQEIRRFVRKILELDFFHVAVLSYQELSPDVKVQPIGRISLDHEKALENEDEEDEDGLDLYSPLPAMT